jgi:hypothetical protein
MDRLYSLSLLAALILGSCGVLTALVAWLAGRGLRLLRALDVTPRRLARSARDLGAFGGIALLLSVAVHLTSGHRPGTPAALGPWAFVAAHPAFGTAFLLSVFAFFWGRQQSLAGGHRDAASPPADSGAA